MKRPGRLRLEAVFAGLSVLCGAAAAGGGLTVDLQVTEVASQPGGHDRWLAEVVVTCVAGAGRCGHLRAELRYAPVGGDPARIPVSESGQPSSQEPFVIPLAFRDREIVVALWSTANELRVLALHPTGLPQVVAQADLPDRIEALGVGDVDDDGLDEIVVGLDGTAAAQLRVFDLDHDSGVLTETIVSGVLPQHVEGLHVGDADNDGRNEIVVGLEYGSEVFSRVRYYELDGGAWQEHAVSAPDSLHVQDVQVGDVDDDGSNEIVAIMSVSGAVGPTQVRLFRLVGSQWVVENATALQPDRSAERVVVADVDADGDNEIVTAYWDADGFIGNPSDATRLVTIDKVGGQWIETTIDTDFVVDGLAVGDLDGDARPDVMAGQWATAAGFARGYEWNPGLGGWELTFATPPLGEIWDVDLGDYDNDWANEVVIANDVLLRGAEADGTMRILGSYPVRVDSALVYDFDHDEPGNPRVCDPGPTGSCTEVFELVSGAGSPAGSWEIAALAAELNGSAGGVSTPVVVETPGGLIGAGGRVPDGSDPRFPPLTVTPLAGSTLRLAWSASCRQGDDDYAIYEGEIGSPASLFSVTCSTSGQLQWDLTPSFDRSFFVVVPTDGTTEGSYGLSSAGERPPSGAACLPLQLGAPICP